MAAALNPVNTSVNSVTRPWTADPSGQVRVQGHGNSTIPVVNLLPRFSGVRPAQTH
jgi:hypothetical protein